MVAAENAALPGAKVGGVADVVHQVSVALTDLGCRVVVVIPAHGFLHRLPRARKFRDVAARSGARELVCGIYEVVTEPSSRVRHFVVDHDEFRTYDPQRNRFRIYSADLAEAPYASDANKYALFCLAVGEALRQGIFENVDCLHLHDWHAAFLAILRRYDPSFAFLKDLRTVYSVHNFAYQGVRPFGGESSSLLSWFPALEGDYATRLADPIAPHCFNAMASGLELSDVVHVVAPGYVTEIVSPSDPERGFSGGVGLESRATQAHAEGRLVGILNGCEYPDSRQPPALEFPELLALLERLVLRWVCRQGRGISPVHFIASTRLLALRAGARRPSTLVTAVSRITSQKVRLLRERGSTGVSGLEGILETLGNRGVFVLLGTGERGYEEFLTEVSASFENFVFLNGYSDACASALYASGDLFLMPSSFEPCGISQMLAMRDGQPCLVHATGGLKDTVRAGVTGFTFSGENPRDQVGGMLRSFGDALTLKETRPREWAKIRAAAKAERFPWSKSAREYMEKLYARRGGGKA